MKEIVSIITKVIVVILADGFTVFAKRMSLQLQQTYSQTSGYISNLVWIILLGILFIISIRVCNVEKKDI